ncbi:Mlo-related protein [Corchorus capsularis]|uniref:Mlo-related protein n=1 Tax=Corchorus capsularis TaxID=210143 RepID=A0A1R3HF98_COCAP|nr:Mlo-related protein [Corchorus capsularis]
MAESSSLEFKPTWVVAAVCFVIILISLFAERGLNHLGKCLRHNNQDALFEALQKLKAGEGPFVINGIISSAAHFHICSGSCSCGIMCHYTGSWRSKGIAENSQSHHRRKLLEQHAMGYWRKAAVVSWIMSFFKQFYCSVTESEYIALREGFIMKHCPDDREFNFHKYMMVSLERDFRHVVGISWYQWLFVVVFMTLNVDGWHTYFWLSFLPVILLILVGAKLEHIIVRLAQDVVEMRKPLEEQETIKPSDEYFWFTRPRIVLDFIHFILFQNAFEIAFFFWILWTYGFNSCIMEGKGYIIPRLIMGVIVQVLCSYITLPLYALVTKMGTSFESVQVPLQSPGMTI